MVLAESQSLLYPVVFFHGKGELHLTGFHAVFGCCITGLLLDQFQRAYVSRCSLGRSSVHVHGLQLKLYVGGVQGILCIQDRIVLGLKAAVYLVALILQVGLGGIRLLIGLQVLELVFIGFDFIIICKRLFPVSIRVHCPNPCQVRLRYIPYLRL